jgi:hypothetical protein
MPSIQIRNVPEELREKLKALAAAEGKSLSGYVLTELHRIGGMDQADGQPTPAEWLERLRSRSPVGLGMSTAEAIRELRGPLPTDDLTRK